MPDVPQSTTRRFLADIDATGQRFESNACRFAESGTGRIFARPCPALCRALDRTTFESRHVLSVLRGHTAVRTLMGHGQAGLRYPRDTDEFPFPVRPVSGSSDRNG